MKRKKSVKMRGSRTHGYGSHKKHRGSGSRGGSGLSGGLDHKKIYAMKFMPGHIGKRGFKSLYQRKLKESPRSINVGELEGISEGKKELDLTELGYSKVLGKGEPCGSFVVKADYFTPKAKEKIEKAGGRAIEPEADGEGGEEPEAGKGE
jgi:large subunit ribosomal protein L15